MDEGTYREEVILPPSSELVVGGGGGGGAGGRWRVRADREGSGVSLWQVSVIVHVLLLDAGWHWANLCPFPHLTPREPELLTSTNGFPVRADSLRVFVFVFVFSSRRLLAAFFSLEDSTVITTPILR